MNTMLEIQEQSTQRLFQELHHIGIPYAVLRNYEQFPFFSHDIDLVIDSHSLPQWRKILCNLAREQGWDLLLECHHWNHSAFRHHNIEVFRFYQLSKPEYLQIDLFHGFPLWSASLYTEASLLADRQYDERGFYRISASTEAIIRLFQIARLSEAGAKNAQKISRYRERLLNAEQDETNHFIRQLEKRFPKNGVKAWTALKQGDFEAFKKQITTLKSYFLQEYISRNPILAAKEAGSRLIDYWHGYFHSPCGQIIPIYAPESESRQLLAEALQALKQANIIHQWAYHKGNQNLLSFSKRCILERGGFLIQWVKHPSQATLCVLSGLSVSDLIQKLIFLIAAQHQVLYKGTNTQKHEGSGE